MRSLQSHCCLGRDNISFRDTGNYQSVIQMGWIQIRAPDLGPNCLARKELMPHYRYSKTCLKRPLSKRPKMVFKTNYRLMQINSIAKCSKGSILQYFRPSFNYHLRLRSLFCLFLSGCLRQVFLYMYILGDNNNVQFSR